MIKKCLVIVTILLFVSPQQPALCLAAGNVRSPKVLIFIDMEGLSGINRAAQVYYDRPVALGVARQPKTKNDNGPDYQEGRRLLTEDVNAAIRGLKAGGAGEIVVVDAHSSGNTEEPDILLDQMDKRASFDFRAAPFDMYVDSPNATYQAIVCVGMHARTGTEGFLAHTFSSDFSYKVNGVYLSETNVVALLAARFSIPVIMVSGDDVLKKHLAEQMPGIEYALVKKARGRTDAELLPLDEAHANIERAARNAIQKLSSIKPYSLGKPYNFQLSFENRVQTNLVASLTTIYPELKRVDDVTVAFTAEDFLKGWEISKTLRRAMSLERFMLLLQLLDRNPQGRVVMSEFEELLLMRWLEPQRFATALPPANQTPKNSFFGAY